MVSAILVCAGQGLRAGFEKNKLLVSAGGNQTPFSLCLSRIKESGVADEYIVVCREEDEKEFSCITDALGVRPLFVKGGKDRSDSVFAGVNAAKGEIVVVHDGARPYAPSELFAACVRSAEEKGSGVAVVPSADTLCECEDGENITRSFRKGIYRVQTPQAFKRELLLKAFSMKKPDEEFTDESGLYEKYVAPAAAVRGSEENLKLTYKSDFALRGNLFAGTGFDLHIFAENRKLILGGVEIPYKKGLLGHSDADVLTHAIMDALLSSASLGDIGVHFPDTDERYRGISSMILLEKVMELLKKSGYKPKNATAVIMAQKPKLAPFVAGIRKNLASALGVDESAVGITCTTLEGIGTVGREEGIAVQAYVLTERE